MSQNIIDKLQRENITLAPFKKRALAYAIDELLLSMLFLIIYWDMLEVVKSYEETVMMTSNLLVQIFALKVVYQAFFTWYYGASIGKIVMKIVCVDTDLLDKPNFKISIIRALMRVVSENVFFLGCIWAFSNPLLQTWHDKFAKTVVIDVY
ncbi:RDD family protein [Campylobacter sp. RM16192]|uniref:RDD family protein n=1 Tax=Campylobacter sp. RM16192 TaxID=1660080 RepID=UPI001451F0D9|nr:RDD family protein [Campylobacter sp. RM16192]QCD53042.1 putative protein (RDD domain) [Campylobacter sp. RM16192]